MTFDKLSRRHLLKGTAALTLGTALPLRGAFAAETTVGFIYVGSRDDYGYNQAHAAGAAALKKMPGIKVVEEEKVPETDAVEKTMESMINLDGATLLFPTSFGYYNPHMLKTAAKFPKLRFEHCGGLWSEKDPKNAGSYFGYIDEAQHVSGIVAGTMSKTGKLGFVAAKPIPQVLRNINAFTLGAKLANPKVTTQVIFTGDWSMPVKEAEATNSLIDQGVDVLTCHVDGPKTVVENAARRGAFVCGYHVNQSVLAPLIPGTDVHWGLAFGIIAAVASYILIYHTVFGFAARVAGGNIRAAEVVGLSVGKLILIVCFLAGAAAGLAGMMEVAAVQGRTNANLAAGYGFAGILVAFLARQNPLAVIPVAVLLGGIGASGGLLQRRLGLPDASVLVLEGVIFVLVLASDTLYGRLSFLKGKS